jgi:hypothetical protein
MPVASACDYLPGWVRGIYIHLYLSIYLSIYLFNTALMICMSVRPETSGVSYACAYARTCRR